MRDRRHTSRDLLPRSPATPHLPSSGSVQAGDLVATPEAVERALATGRALYEEKLDGAAVGVLDDGEGEPIIRSRDHVLSKGYAGKTGPGKLQYRPLWTWVYDHRDRFRSLTKWAGVPVAVYAEWLYARHTVPYDRLPEIFIPHGLLVDGEFIDPLVARVVLESVGFTSPPLLDDATAVGISAWSTLDGREGVYIKVGDGERLVARFKSVRPGFVPRPDFCDGPIERNGIVRGVGDTVRVKLV